MKSSNLYEFGADGVMRCLVKGSKKAYFLKALWYRALRVAELLARSKSFWEERMKTRMFPRLNLSSPVSSLMAEASS